MESQARLLEEKRELQVQLEEAAAERARGVKQLAKLAKALAVTKEEAITSGKLLSAKYLLKRSLTASYVESCTADATITRGANALSPRKKPRGPSVR